MRRLLKVPELIMGHHTLGVVALVLRLVNWSCQRLIQLRRGLISLGTLPPRLVSLSNVLC